MKYKNPMANNTSNMNNGDEQPPQGKGGRFTKFYSLYVFKVLTEEANENNPLKVAQIAESVNDNYNISISNDTVQEYIRLFRDDCLYGYELLGDPHNGYYLENIFGDIMLSGDCKLDDIEINILAQMIKTSRSINVGAKNSIIKKLAAQGSEQVEAFLNKYKFMPKIDEDTTQNLLLAEDMIQIIQQQRPILLQDKRYSNKSPRKFYTYAIIPNRDGYVLVGTFGGPFATFIPSKSIIKYEVLEDEIFNKKPLRIKPGVFVNDNVQEILKQDYSKDFVFPKEYELAALKQNVRVRLQEMENIKNKPKNGEEK